MPNHVINEIVLHGVSADRVKSLVLNNEGKISFQVLLPLPLNYWAGDVGQEHEQHFPGTQLDAARQTWGTKWDAYGDPELSERDGSVVLVFQTAWAHPRGWTCALFNSLDCQITASWLDEGREDGAVEKYAPSTDPFGPRWMIEDIPGGSVEHRRLHKMLWGVEEFEPEANPHAD